MAINKNKWYWTINEHATKQRHIEALNKGDTSVKKCLTSMIKESMVTFGLNLDELKVDYNHTINELTFGSLYDKRVEEGKPDINYFSMVMPYIN
jgi:hypothetical protein